MNGQEGGVSDWMILNQTRPRQYGAADPGWSTLGSALGGGIQASGTLANLRGMQTGATTALAMASARQRVDQNKGIEGLYQDFQSNPDLATQFGLTPQTASVLRDAALANPNIGSTILNLARGANTGQQTNTNAQIMNPATTPEQRNLDLATRAPGAFAPKPVGVAGSSFAPAIGPAGTSNVAPDQHAIDASTAALHNAGAAAEAQNAQSNAVRAAAAQTRAAAVAAAAANGLPKGYMWQVGPDGKVVIGPNGKPVSVPNPNAGVGVYPQLYGARVSSAGEGLAAEAQNIGQMMQRGLPTKGLLGVGSSSGNVFEVGANMLGRQLSSTAQNQYNSTMAGVGRFVTSMENMGLAPRGQLSAQIEQALTATPGDTPLSIAYKTSLIRQYAEASNRAVQASTFPASEKADFASSVARIVKSLPYEPSDVLSYETATKKGFTGSLSQFAAQLKSGKLDPRFAPAPGTPGAAPAPAAASAPPPDIQALIQKYAGGKPGG
ncbi:MAG: hypothetical protein KGL39_14780 [Patescibacteria group bacterium]|nr:hypothetical protein [Patescibacteria group bacterium]